MLRLVVLCQRITVSQWVCANKEIQKEPGNVLLDIFSLLLLSILHFLILHYTPFFFPYSPVFFSLLCDAISALSWLFLFVLLLRRFFLLLHPTFWGWVVIFYFLCDVIFSLNHWFCFFFFFVLLRLGSAPQQKEHRKTRKRLAFYYIVCRHTVVNTCPLTGNDFLWNEGGMAGQTG